jgi:hypothetical protein
VARVHSSRGQPSFGRMILCRRGRFPHRGAGRSRHPMSGGFARYQPSRWPSRCATLGKVSMRFQNACGSDAILLSSNTKRPAIEGFLYTVTSSRTSHIGSGSQRARINAGWMCFRAISPCATLGQARMRISEISTARVSSPLFWN